MEVPRWLGRTYRVERGRSPSAAATQTVAASEIPPGPLQAEPLRARTARAPGLMPAAPVANCCVNRKLTTMFKDRLQCRPPPAADRTDSEGSFVSQGVCGHWRTGGMFVGHNGKSNLK
ncbi:hypothetical protein LBMAG56_23600 [Verrucomicrobiota bacterium]|nr:hypothetical protein LBMAG56_23600 [Verrucomicrobiota bacterium]